MITTKKKRRCSNCHRDITQLKWTHKYCLDCRKIVSIQARKKGNDKRVLQSRKGKKCTLCNRDIQKNVGYRIYCPSCSIKASKGKEEERCKLRYKNLKDKIGMVPSIAIPTFGAGLKKGIIRVVNTNEATPIIRIQNYVKRKEEEIYIRALQDKKYMRRLLNEEH